MTNKEVLALQKKLNAKGYRDKNGNRLAEDGLWGAKTEYAWKKYQQPQANTITSGQNKGEQYFRNKREEDLAKILNKQSSKPSIAVSAAQPRSWLDSPQAKDPLLKKLEQAMQVEPEAKRTFSSPDKILDEQVALNALGFTGRDGKELSENGELDLDTLVAWDKLRHNSNIFGNANSQIMQVVEGKDQEGRNSKIIADIAKGMVPSTSFISPLQSDITGVKYRIIEGKPPKNNPDLPGLKHYQLFDKKTNQRLFEIHQHSLNGSHGQPVKHINVETSKNATPQQISLSKKLNEKPIPIPVYEKFHNFDKVTNVVKKGGKALGAIGLALDVSDMGYTIYSDLNDEDQKLGKDTVQTAVGIGGSWVGGIGGAKLGAMGLSAIGTLICPGLGTVIGGFIGGIGGGIAGALGGREAGEWVVEKAYE